MHPYGSYSGELLVLFIKLSLLDFNIFLPAFGIRRYCRIGSVCLFASTSMFEASELENPLVHNMTHVRNKQSVQSYVAVTHQVNKAAKVHTRTKALIHSCWTDFRLQLGSSWTLHLISQQILTPLYKHNNIHFCQHQNKFFYKKRSTLSQGNIKNEYTTIFYTPGNFATRKREHHNLDHTTLVLYLPTTKPLTILLCAPAWWPELRSDASLRLSTFANPTKCDASTQQKLSLNMSKVVYYTHITIQLRCFITSHCSYWTKLHTWLWRSHCTAH